MTPEVSRAVGQVIERLGLTSSIVTDELRAAAEQAKTVDDLPRWVRNVLPVVMDHAD